MRRPTPILLSALLFTLSLNLFAAPSADEILARAKSTAAAEKKTVFLKFDSPGCGWCKLLDEFLAAPAIQPIFKKYFVIANLRVPDIAGNPGAIKALERSGGINRGVPFHLFLDSKGDPLVNSLREGKENIGYPENPVEISWFLSMVRKAAPSLTEEEAASIEKQLRDHPK